MLDDLLDHLENIGGVEFAVIKSPELGRYWAKKVKDREAVRKHEDALKKLKASLTKENHNLIEEISNIRLTMIDYQILKDENNLLCPLLKFVFESFPNFVSKFEHYL